MKLLIDADIIAYHSVFSKEGATVTGLLDKIDEIMESIFSACVPYGQPTVYSTYLTGKNNFRYGLSPIYKAQRPSEKPVTLELARDYLVQEWQAKVTDGIEADDAIATEANALGFDNVIIVSIDKDFKQLPCLIYNYQKQTWLQVSEWGSKINFYTQVLVGDQADNIKGVDGIGPKKAAKALEECKTEQDLYQACLKLYKASVGDPMEAVEKLDLAAQLLWLRREPNQKWQKPS